MEANTAVSAIIDFTVQANMVPSTQGMTHIQPSMCSVDSQPFTGNPEILILYKQRFLKTWGKLNWHKNDMRIPTILLFPTFWA